LARKTHKPETGALERLRQARAFVFDVDGTLLLGDRRNVGLNPLPGAIELLELLRARKIPFALLTNGTVRTPEQYIVELRRVGLPVADGTMITPSRVAAEHFSRQQYKRVRALGVEGVRQPLEAAGIEVVSGPGNAPVDAVFVGWYREFHMDEIESACNAVAAGARLFTGSLAPYFASAQGKVLSSSRIICAAITSVTGKRATIMGKPAAAALLCACRSIGAKPSEVVVVGDDPALEIFMARRADAFGVAVRTGVWGQGEVARLPAVHRPHLTVQGVAELVRHLDRRTIG
jgi:NagD protein